MTLLKRSVTVLITLACHVPSAEATALTALQARAQRCLQAGESALCQQALVEAEVLQRRASARNAFPCQTLLLGVQADLVLQQLGQGRGAQAVDDLNAAVRGCAGL